MLPKILAMYIGIAKDVIGRALRCSEARPLCNRIKPGVFRCYNNRYTIALYRVKHWALDIHTLSQLDYIYSLKRFLEVFQIDNCRSMFFADIEPFNSSSYMSKLNNKLQMKLIELEMDKTNVKLQDYVRKLIETRKKILMGIKPIRITNIVALVCSNITRPEDIDRVTINAKNVLNIDLDPLIEQDYAEVIANFCCC